jgi:ligand-binding SRPBCC domain-containing protein
LLPIFKLGAGGPLGSGKQWMPWIHLSDLADMFCFALDHDVSGPMAGVAPDYAQNRRVMQAIGNALGRPSLAPAPGFALKLVVGEFADTLLGGQLIIPTTALDAGFKWKHPSLEQALIDLLSPARPRATGIQTFESEQVVPGSVEAVFAFFSEAGNLARITPPGMGFRIDAEKATASRRGAVIDYALRVHGIGMRWRSMIAQWDPGVGFVDVQLRGPYQLWRHTHAFEKREGGVAVRDLVEWSLPFAPLSAVAQALVRRDLENVFAFRRRKVEEIFAG